MSVPTPQDQAAVIDFLARPESHGIATPVERIDTHGAIIFLAGERAYKLKRAVKLPYLDFSTLEARRDVCQRELTINRRTAPELYLDVVPVRKSGDGALGFGGDGEIVDWTIVMRRFPQEALLDKLCVRGQLDAGLIARLAAVIRRFHGEAEQAPRARWSAVIARIIGTLEQTLTSPEAAPLGLSAPAYLARLRQEYETRKGLIAERQEAGYVRRCHGDLHLKNIVLLDGAPVLFDALEFDEDLATIDVLYDLAFLLMDLWHRGREREANTLLSLYFEPEAPGRAFAGLALLPLFLSMRAAIRAMVGVHGLAFVPEAERPDANQAIRTYTALAAEMLAPQRPELVAVGGLSGTGKTTVAQAIAPLIGAVPGAVIIRTDVERKLMLGVAPLTRLPAEAYAPEVSDAVYRRVADKAAEILRAGHSAVIDAAFLQPAQRHIVAAVAAAADASFQGLWLDAPPDLLLARVSQRFGDASDADVTVVRRQLQSGAPAPAGWHIVDAGGNLEQTTAGAVSVLQAARKR